MLKSMTGYGKSHFQDENLSLDIEIKTINSRYQDVNIRMPYQLNFMEDKINKLVSTYIKRGRVDVFIRSKKKNLTSSLINIDLDQAKLMHGKLYELATLTGISPDTITINDLLSNDDILSYEAEEVDEEGLSKLVLDNIELVLRQVVNMRIIEGQNLKTDLLSNVDLLDQNLDHVSAEVENIKEEIKEKLYKNISEIIEKDKIDQDRLANEVVYYADRQDVNEEITRLKSHISQFKNTLDFNGPVGKKLDFISQEMLRETNTIGSKSSKIDVTNQVIEMKTLVEKIKEQVQNIE